MKSKKAMFGFLLTTILCSAVATCCTHQKAQHAAEPEPSLAPPPPSSTHPVIVGETFKDGHSGDRMAAKLSIGTGNVETFASLGALLDDLKHNTDDDFMRHHVTPALTTAPTCGRCQYEDRNVKIKAWLYVVKHENNDNDFHVILGESPSTPNRRYLTAEVSALPTADDSYDTIKAVRDVFKPYYAGLPVVTGVWHGSAAGFPVTITGSLFFDVDHAAGVVGPVGYKPATAWEIHPVTDIKFSH